ncbi:hypothetical protein MMC25_008281 [Agyrium rufum]|nr:hypothetical protein [Agyrium rufum]
MPRQQRRGATPARSAPTRPTVAPARPSQQPSRPSSTAAAPPAQASQQPQQSSGGSGLFGQMASTAAGVAVGSSIGHAIGGFFGGGSAQPAADAQENSLAATSQNYQDNNTYGRSCENDARAFTKCMDENKGDYAMTTCGWYLDQLKACQQAASQY